MCGRWPHPCLARNIHDFGGFSIIMCGRWPPIDMRGDFLVSDSCYKHVWPLAPRLDGESFVAPEATNAYSTGINARENVTGRPFFGSRGATCKSLWPLAPAVRREIVMICAAVGLLQSCVDSGPNSRDLAFLSRQRFF